MHKTALRIRGCVVGTTIALSMLVAVWLLSGGLSPARALFAVVITAPLWLAVPRLNAGQRRTYAWLSLAVIPYFVLAITEAVANPAARGWAATCLFLAFALFVMLIGYLRITK